MAADLWSDGHRVFLMISFTTLRSRCQGLSRHFAGLWLIWGIINQVLSAVCPRTARLDVYWYCRAFGSSSSFRYLQSRGDPSGEDDVRVLYDDLLVWSSCAVVWVPCCIRLQMLCVRVHRLHVYCPYPAQPYTIACKKRSTSSRKQKKRLKNAWRISR